MKRYYSLLLIAAVIAGCGGGGGGSSSSSSSKPTQSTQQSRAQLEVEDTLVEFSQVGAIAHANMSNVQGTIEYQVVAAEPANMVQVNDLGQLQILKPGIATIKAIDSASGFAPSEAEFTVTVNKGTNPDLVVNELNLNASNQDGEPLIVRGQRGQVSFEVVDGDEHLVRVDRNGRVFAIGAQGQARIRIHDTGDEFYQARDIYANVSVYQIGADQLQFAPLSPIYREGLTLEPVRLDDVEIESIAFKLADSNAQSDVVEILDQSTGLLLIHNAGQVEIEATATYSQGFVEQQQTARFVVNVAKGQRQAINSVNIAANYSANQSLYPRVSNAKGDYYFDVVEGQDVVGVSPNGGALIIQGVGQAKVNIVERDIRNFPATQTQITVDIDAAPHPLIEDVEIDLTYQDELTVPLQFSGQKGKLTLVGSIPEGLQIAAGKAYVNRAGNYTLRFEDDGGEYYQPTQFNVVLDVAKAQGSAMPVRDYEVVYSVNHQFQLLRDFELLASGDAIEVLDNSQPSVADAIANGLVHVYKAGETTLTLRRKESQNYTAGPEQKVTFTILSAPSRIQISSDVEDNWNALKPLATKPTITGVVGQVSYAFAEGSATDVVSLDPDSGEMRILNAGSTRVVVSDAGNEQYSAGQASFAVTVKPIESRATIAYPQATYGSGDKLQPVVNGDGVEATYRLINQASPSVEMASDNGELTILHAGDYTVEATLTGRNFLTKKVSYQGTVKKADHPGLSVLRQEVEFEPFKTVMLDFGQAIGKRSYKFQDTSSENMATLDQARGAITLKGYDFGRSVLIRISEEETRDYNAMPDTLVRVALNLSESGVADKYTNLTAEQTVIGSELNELRFANLEESEFGIMGARLLREPTDAELVEHGEGKVAWVLMKPKGSDNPADVRPVWLHIARFDGCSAVLDPNDLNPSLAIDYAAEGYCKTGETIRLTRYLVIEDSRLEQGTEYEMISPLIQYRRGYREFMASKRGGFYAEPGVIYGEGEYGFIDSMYEWAVVTFDYQTN
ncbi:cadherin repeat domain-containing protein [Vibrio sinaloensis]|uniref:cadherin repeat domain-containing protein n=1 Tax=Photobacterium sp. (strain ATCC 43367) TaxID=379097 RepID=UPI0035E8D43D